MRDVVGLIALLVSMLMGPLMLAQIAGAIELPELTFWAAFGITMACGSYAWYGWLWPLTLYGERTPDAQRVLQVRRSGAPVARITRGSFLRRVAAKNSPMFDFTVHPGGIVIKPAALPPCAIYSSEIVDVRVEKTFFGRTCELHHRSPEIESPLLIHPEQIDAFRNALGRR